MIRALIICVFIQAISGQEGSDCRTPSFDEGICININSCESLLAILKSARQNQYFRNYLIRSTCGYSFNTPLVCCPNYSLTTSTPISTSPIEISRSSIPISTSSIPISTNSIPISTSSIPISTTSIPTSTSSIASSTTLNTITSTTTKENIDTKLPIYPKCGISNSTDYRIVGGMPAKLGQFPWMVALGYRNAKNRNQPKWLCGGSLITTRHVLTAAHCVIKDLYLARLGELELYSKDDGANPIDVGIIDTAVHEGYNTTYYINDIAILTLEKDIEHPSVWPICLPTAPSLRSQTFEGRYGFVAGWGSIYYKGPSSDALQYVSLPIAEMGACKAAFSRIKAAVIDDKVLCAGYPTGSKDSCKGDSGGPLMLPQRENGQFIYYLAGVVSYGVKCADPGYYGVYSKTSAFMDWILANLW